VKTWGSASTLGVELGPPRCLSSNRRERAARKSLRNVRDTREEEAGRCCQQKSHSELGQKGSGSPSWIRTAFDERAGDFPATFHDPSNGCRENLVELTVAETVTVPLNTCEERTWRRTLNQEGKCA